MVKNRLGEGFPIKVSQSFFGGGRGRGYSRFVRDSTGNRTRFESISSILLVINQHACRFPVKYWKLVFQGLDWGGLGSFVGDSTGN